MRPLAFIVAAVLAATSVQDCQNKGKIVPATGTAEMGSSPTSGAASPLERAGLALCSIAVRFGPNQEYVGWPQGRTIDDGPQWYTNEAGAMAKDGPMIDLQPGGTPTVLAAFVRVYQLTKDPRALVIARTIGDTLLSIQDACTGGWHYDVAWIGGKWVPVMVWDAKRQDDVACIRGVATLDDAISQSCALALLRLAQAGGGDRYLAGARRFGDVLVGLKDVKDASGRRPYEHGGIPQVIPLAGAMGIEFGEKGTPGEHYYVHKTLNDYTTRDAVWLLIELWKETKDAKYLTCIRLQVDYLLDRFEKLGHRAWCQQYDVLTDKPQWASHKEPPAIVSGENGIDELLLSWWRVETDATRKRRIEETLRTELVYWKRMAPRVNPTETDMAKWLWARYYKADDGTTPIYASDYQEWFGFANASKGAPGQSWELGGPRRWLLRILTADDKLDLSRLDRWASSYLTPDEMLALTPGKRQAALDSQDQATGLWVKTVKCGGTPRVWMDTSLNASRLVALAGE